MAPGKTPSPARSVTPDRDTWLGAFDGVFTRIVLFGIEGTSARVTAVSGLSDILIGTTVSLAEQTPLRWSIEAASPIVGAGRSPSGEIMAKTLKLAAPRAFAVVPLVIGKKLAGLVYGDRGSEPLPIKAVSDVFASCEQLLNPLSRTSAPPPERTAFKSTARRDERIRRAPRPNTIRTRAPQIEEEAPPPPPVDVSPPPVPEEVRPTVVLDRNEPWTPFTDVTDGDEVSEAFANIPELPEFEPSAAWPASQPTEAKFEPGVSASTARADTHVEPDDDLSTPVPIPRDVLLRAERLVSEQVSASRRNRWVFAAAGLLSFLVCLYFFAPTGMGANEHKVVTLPAEATPSMIGDVLATAGLVRSAKGFALVGEIAGVGGLRAGSYSLSTNQWPWQVARELTHGGSALHDVVIPNGGTLGDIARQLEQAGVVSAEAFVQAAHDKALLERLGITTGDAQGWLAPGAYAFAQDIPAVDVVSVMVERFFASLNTIETTRHLTVAAKTDVVILASIVEREARDKSEAPRIAGLFTNRLKLGMRLESRATALYILGIDKKELTLADVRQPSPFNTHLNPGLPPAPIASPSLEALRAAADPEQNAYYYMTDKDDGAHVFSATYEEHLKAQRANR